MIREDNEYFVLVEFDGFQAGWPEPGPDRSQPHPFHHIDEPQATLENAVHLILEHGDAEGGAPTEQVIILKNMHDTEQFTIGTEERVLERGDELRFVARSETDGTLSLSLL